MCTSLTAALDAPVPLQGLDLRISASIGAAQAQAGDTIEDLMHRADTAMYAEQTRTDRRANATPEANPAVAAQKR